MPQGVAKMSWTFGEPARPLARRYRHIALPAALIALATSHVEVLADAPAKLEWSKVLPEIGNLGQVGLENPLRLDSAGNCLTVFARGDEVLVTKLDSSGSLTWQSIYNAGGHADASKILLDRED